MLIPAENLAKTPFSTLIKDGSVAAGMVSFGPSQSQYMQDIGTMKKIRHIRRNDIEELSPAQKDIVSRLLDKTQPTTYFRTFVVKKQFDKLKPFITFPAARACIEVTPTRCSKKERASHARRDWVLEHQFGHKVFRIETKEYLSNPLEVLSSIVWKVVERSRERLGNDPKGWTKDVEAFTSNWSLEVYRPEDNLQDFVDDYCSATTDAEDLENFLNRFQMDITKSGI